MKKWVIYNRENGDRLEITPLGDGEHTTIKAVKGRGGWDGGEPLIAAEHALDVSLIWGLYRRDHSLYAVEIDDHPPARKLRDQPPY